jgi:hypothetical protein
LTAERLGLLVAAAWLLSACTNPSTTALGTNVPLATPSDLGNDAPRGAMVWRSPDLAQHERMASAYFIPPATVYHGKGASFGNLSPQQLDQIAADLTRQVRTEVGRRFKLAKTAGPGTFTLELIVVKVNPPHQEYVTSGPYEVSALAVGMPDAGGLTAGSMTVAGRFIDSESGKMLVAFSTPVSGGMMDTGGRGSDADGIGFAQSASEQFATDLVKAIVRQRRNVNALSSN